MVFHKFLGNREYSQDENVLFSVLVAFANPLYLLSSKLDNYSYSEIDLANLLKKVSVI